MRPVHRRPTRDGTFSLRLEHTMNDLGWGCQVDASSPRHETEAAALGGKNKSKVAARLNQVRHPAPQSKGRGEDSVSTT
jgi:hypothetical protein